MRTHLLALLLSGCGTPHVDDVSSFQRADAASWWCADGHALGSRCERTESDCVAAVTSMAATGLIFGDCHRATDAVCFGMRGRPQRIFWRVCFAQLSHCVSSRNALVHLHDPAYEVASSCLAPR